MGLIAEFFTLGRGILPACCASWLSSKMPGPASRFSLSLRFALSELLPRPEKCTLAAWNGPSAVVWLDLSDFHHAPGKPCIVCVYTWKGGVGGATPDLGGKDMTC